MVLYIRYLISSFFDEFAGISPNQYQNGKGPFFTFLFFSSEVYAWVYVFTHFSCIVITTLFHQEKKGSNLKCDRIKLPKDNSSRQVFDSPPCVKRIVIKSGSKLVQLCDNSSPRQLLHIVISRGVHKGQETRLASHDRARLTYWFCTVLSDVVDRRFSLVIKLFLYRICIWPLNTEAR